MSIHRRPRRVIEYQILEAAIEPVCKTAIMHRAYVNHKRLNKYLSKMMKRGEIIFEDRKYRTTPEGLRKMRNILAGYRRGVKATSPKNDGEKCQAKTIYRKKLRKS